jgi:hypothetical protein
MSPHYLAGRKLILYLQSLLKPLQIINNEFVEWAKETKIEATMTSQVIKFEWYLNRKLGKYLLNASQQISIKNGERVGVPVYFETADIPQSDNILLKYETEGKKNSIVLNYNGELTEENECSFFVFSPEINTQLISKEEYLALLSYYIDKYRISGKTYKIKFNQ